MQAAKAQDLIRRAWATERVPVLFRPMPETLFKKLPPTDGSWRRIYPQPPSSGGHGCPRAGYDRGMLDPLPNFLIIGAPRSGTTSLWNYLRGHPGTFFPRKEIHFFDANFAKGVDWYREIFAEAPREVTVRGEATPFYLGTPEANERIVQVVPRAKLAVSLRDPVDRMWSHYWMLYERDLERRPFDELLDAELDRFAASGPEAPELFYLRHSLYHGSLTRLHRLHPDAEIWVGLFDDLVAEPAEVVRSLCAFLDIDEEFHPENLGQPVNAYVQFRSTRLRNWTRRHAGRAVRRLVGGLNTRSDGRYPDMPVESRRQLQDFLEPDILGLQEATGRDLGSWLA